MPQPNLKVKKLRHREIMQLAPNHTVSSEAGFKGGMSLLRCQILLEIHNTLQFAHVRYTIQWLLVYVTDMQIITTVNLRTFKNLPVRNWVPIRSWEVGFLTGSLYPISMDEACRCPVTVKGSAGRQIDYHIMMQ